jgi:hypothetical protein
VIRGGQKVYIYEVRSTKYSLTLDVLYLEIFERHRLAQHMLEHHMLEHHIAMQQSLTALFPNCRNARPQPDKAVTTAPLLTATLTSVDASLLPLRWFSVLSSQFSCLHACMPPARTAIRSSSSSGSSAAAHSARTFPVFISETECTSAERVVAPYRDARMDAQINSYLLLTCYCQLGLQGYSIYTVWVLYGDGLHLAPLPILTQTRDSKTLWFALWPD